MREEPMPVPRLFPAAGKKEKRKGGKDEPKLVPRLFPAAGKKEKRKERKNEPMPVPRLFPAAGKKKKSKGMKDVSEEGHVVEASVRWSYVSTFHSWCDSDLEDALPSSLVCAL